MENNNQSAFILFKTEDENISVDVRFEEDTVWLSQEQNGLAFWQGTHHHYRTYTKYF